MASRVYATSIASTTRCLGDRDLSIVRPGAGVSEQTSLRCRPWMSCGAAAGPALPALSQTGSAPR